MLNFMLDFKPNLVKISKNLLTSFVVNLDFYYCCRYYFYRSYFSGGVSYFAFCFGRKPLPAGLWKGKTCLLRSCKVEGWLKMGFLVTQDPFFSFGSKRVDFWVFCWNSVDFEQKIKLIFYAVFHKTQVIPSSCTTNYYVAFSITFYFHDRPFF